MKRRRRPQIDDLYLPKLLTRVSGEQWQHGEEIIRTSMHPLTDDILTNLDREKWIAASLRTAQLIVFDYEEAFEAITSAGDPPDDLELPPLPFPRVAYEAEGDYGFPIRTAPVDLERDEAYAYVEDQPTAYVIDLVSISEEVPGKEWIVMYVTRIPRDDELLYDRHVEIVRLFSDGRMIRTDLNTGEKLDVTEYYGHKQAHFRNMPIELTHLVTAHGVSLVDIVDRAEKRRAARRGYVHQSIYWVDIRSANETTRGQGDREYHCRWLVRGHWRHLDETRRTWIKPYIKGPAGAPWKGRPVYRVATST